MWGCVQLAPWMSVQDLIGDWPRILRGPVSSFKDLSPVMTLSPIGPLEEKVRFKSRNLAAQPECNSDLGPFRISKLSAERFLPQVRATPLKWNSTELEPCISSQQGKSKTKSMNQYVSDMATHQRGPRETGKATWSHLGNPGPNPAMRIDLQTELCMGLSWERNVFRSWVGQGPMAERALTNLEIHFWGSNWHLKINYTWFSIFNWSFRKTKMHLGSYRRQTKTVVQKICSNHPEFWLYTYLIALLARACPWNHRECGGTSPSANWKLNFCFFVQHQKTARKDVEQWEEKNDVSPNTGIRCVRNDR